MQTISAAWCQSLLGANSVGPRRLSVVDLLSSTAVPASSSFIEAQAAPKRKIARYANISTNRKRKQVAQHTHAHPHPHQIMLTLLCG